MHRVQYVLPGQQVFATVAQAAGVLERHGFDIRGLLQYCFYALDTQLPYKTLEGNLEMDLLDVNPGLWEDRSNLKRLVHLCIDLIEKLRLAISEKLLQYFGHTGPGFRLESFYGLDIVISQDIPAHDPSHYSVSYATPTPRGVAAYPAAIPHRLWHRPRVDSTPLARPG